jgi:hypothetical protein
MRQQKGLSKADLVERKRRSATDSAEMARLTTPTRARSDENIVETGFARYISIANFADRAAPGGVGTLARTIGKLPQHRAKQFC